METEAGDDEQDFRRIVASGDALIVVGTGVSIAASVSPDTGKPHIAASWKGLLKSGLEAVKAIRRLSAIEEKYFGERIDSQSERSLLEAADFISENLGGRSSKLYREWFESTVGSITANNLDVINAIHLLREKGNIVATTNYDDLLIRGRDKLDPITWRNADEIVRTMRHKKIKNIIYFHGYWKDYKSIIFSSEDYKEIVLSKISENENFSKVWLTKVWVYVGCGLSGLTDPDFGLLHARYGKDARSRGFWDYCLVLNSERQDFDLRFENEGINVRAVPYGDSHSDLSKFLRSLITEPTEHSVEAEATRPAKRPTLGAPTSKWWSEVSILGRRHRVFAAASGIDMELSDSQEAPLDPAPTDTTLVVDPEGRAALWLRDGRIKLTWLNRYAEGLSPWVWTSPRQKDLVGARLLALSMDGPTGVLAVVSGRRGTFSLRIAPGEARPISSDKISRTSSRGAVIRGSKDPILIDAKTGVASSPDLLLGLDVIECIDEADLPRGRVRVAVGLSGGKRFLVMKADNNEILKRIPLECGAPEGMAIVRNSAIDTFVVMYADEKVFRFAYPGGSEA